MSLFLCDTNILLYLSDDLSDFHKNVKKAFNRLGQDDEVVVSTLSLYELQYSVGLKVIQKNRDSANQTREMIKNIKMQFPILPLTEGAGWIFGRMKAQNKHEYYSRKLPEEERESIKKLDIDLMIASMALVRRATLVSKDGLFSKIRNLNPDLLLENWARSPED